MSGWFRNHLADCMSTMGYKSCLTDPDIWYKPMVRPEDIFKHYTYMLLYVDDFLCVYRGAIIALNGLDYWFKTKERISW